MKKIKRRVIRVNILLTFMLLSVNISTYAQNGIEDKQAIEMLKDFYTAYNIAWSTTNGNNLIKELDRLQKKYCTARLRNIQQKEGLDHDLLINDEYTDLEHLRKMTITKDPVKANVYIVSYIDHTTQGYKPIDLKVIIHATVIKENGIYKLSSTDMSK